MLVKVAGKDANSVVSALTAQMIKPREHLKQSSTWDRGTELAGHEKFSAAKDIDVYFCDPSSLWQRGRNENTNGLLRQYFPKGPCLSDQSQQDLNKVAAKLNSRPGKTLGFQTPVAKLEAVLQ